MSLCVCYFSVFIITEMEYPEVRYAGLTSSSAIHIIEILAKAEEQYKAKFSGYCGLQTILEVYPKPFYDIPNYFNLNNYKFLIILNKDNSRFKITANPKSPKGQWLYPKSYFLMDEEGLLWESINHPVGDGEDRKKIK